MTVLSKPRDPMILNFKFLWRKVKNSSR